MHRVASTLLVVLALATFSTSAKAQSNLPLPEVPPANEASPPGQSAQAASPGVAINVPSGVTVPLVLTSPVWNKSAKVGDPIYTLTAFPIAIDNQMAIPAGTAAAGVIDALSRPGRFSNHAEFRIHFTKLIYANGYTVSLDGVAANADVKVQVAFSSDVLLDNGSQIEMLLASALSVDADSAAAAVPVSRAPQLSQFRTASRCVPLPGTPGTSPTIIPGTPGTPGTPATVIPGGPGMPPTVIPGTPPTPGTPTTVIPGSPGTPATSCPGPPVVRPGSASTLPPDHSKVFDLTTPLQLSGTALLAGKYRATWNGLGPVAEIEILRGSKLIVRAPARIATLADKSPITKVESILKSDGTLSLHTIRFEGETIELSFDE
jgi:hypothetical protein